MIEEIAGSWFVFCMGNLLADAGIALFALIAYKIGKVQSNYSRALITEAGETAAAAILVGPPKPEPPPEIFDYPPRGISEPIEPWTPLGFVPPPYPPELGRWEACQKYPLILFGIGITIQIIALLI